MCDVGVVVVAGVVVAVAIVAIAVVVAAAAATAPVSHALNDCVCALATASTIVDLRVNLGRSRCGFI